MGVGGHLLASKIGIHYVIKRAMQKFRHRIGASGCGQVANNNSILSRGKEKSHSMGSIKRSSRSHAKLDLVGWDVTYLWKASEIAAAID